MCDSVYPIALLRIKAFVLKFESCVLNFTLFLNALDSPTFCRGEWEDLDRKPTTCIYCFQFHGRGSYQTIWSSPLTNAKWHSVAWPITMIRLHTNVWLFYRTRPFTELWEVSIEHLRRMWHANRGRLLLRTPGPIPYMTWDQFFSRTCRYFSGLCYSNIPRYFLDFALNDIL